MRTLLTLCAAMTGALLATAAPAQATTYTVMPDQTRVHFEVRHFGTSTSRGRFGKVDAAIVLDPAAQRGQLSVTIATADVDTGVGPFDGLLRGNSFLGSAEHPSAYFVASRMRFDGPALKEVQGEFTLRGISKPLTLTATHFACRRDEAANRDVCGGDFVAEFRRSDYGITFALPFVSDTVRLVIQVEAQR
jgi:polyisoprenoid-binding protein YceI